MGDETGEEATQEIEQLAIEPVTPEKPPTFCSKCWQENDAGSIRCSNCGEFLRPPGETPTPLPGAPAGFDRKLEKRANLSFLLSILGWVCCILIFFAVGLSGPEGAETSPVMGFLLLLFLGGSLVLFILSIVFGGLSMGRRNTVNRWKAIMGFILGILGICSLVCCIILLVVFIITEASGQPIVPKP